MDDAADNTIVIPRWFAASLAAFGALAVPWAGWVTITLATIAVKIEAQAELRQKSDALAVRFNDNSQNIQIIIERMLADDARETAFDARLTKLENEIHKR